MAAINVLRDGSNTPFLPPFEPTTPDQAAILAVTNANNIFQTTHINIDNGVISTLWNSQFVGINIYGAVKLSRQVLTNRFYFDVSLIQMNTNNYCKQTKWPVWIRIAHNTNEDGYPRIQITEIMIWTVDMFNCFTV